MFHSKPHHKIKFLFKTIFLISILLSNSVFAWNTLGHMIVANIAYQRLQPGTREKVDNLVSYFQKEYPDMNSFEKIATWPDTLHAQKIETYSHWHYIDIAFSNDGTPLKNLVATDNVVWAINKIKIIVGNSHANAYERGRFLAFLTHIIGDIHHPLHTVSYISATHSNGDEGGNLYFVRHHHAKINLHKLWDEGLDIFSGDITQEHVDALTHTITATYPESYFGKKVDDLNPDDWVKDGMENAKQYVYRVPENQETTPDYIDAGQKITEQEVALAGYRLAKVLNLLLS